MALKKVNYYQLNLWSICFFIGLFLSFLSFLIYKFSLILFFNYIAVLSLFVSYIYFIIYFIEIKDNPFVKAIDFLKSSKNFIYYSLWIFLFFVLVGFFVPLPDVFQQKIFEFLQELALKTQGFGLFEITSFIFFNNFLSGFNGIFFGVLLGVFPIFASVLNGYILGFVGNLVVSSQGFFHLWRILPHGIFELPAIFISFGLGIRLGFYWIRKEKDSFKKLFFESLRAFFFIVVPLLIIASIIEGALIFFMR